MTLQQGLIGHWELEELPAKDSTANANDMSTTGDPQTTTGQVGGAIDFDTDDFLSVSKDFYGGTSQGSLAAWFKTSTSSVFHGIAASNSDLNSEAGGIVLRITNDDVVSVLVNGGDGARIDNTGGTTVTDGSWYHLAATYDGSIVRLYLNGSEVENSAYSTTITGMTPFFIGKYRWEDTGDDFDDPGQVDDVRVYDRALSQTEIQQIKQIRNKRVRQA